MTDEVAAPALVDPAAARWADRAGRAEAAVLSRSLRRLWCLPGTRLGVPGTPPRVAERTFLTWQFWWQAHLLDCVIDAHRRAPSAARAALIRLVTRGSRWRNLGTWHNHYVDDTAWWALALHRAGTTAGPAARVEVRRTASRLAGAWPQDDLGGLPWRWGDEFRNAPANAPAAILLTRTGHVEQAQVIADWIDRQLVMVETSLIADGIRAGDGRIEPTPYTYVQGAVIGLELELALTGGDRMRLHRLVGAVSEHLAFDGVLAGAGGRDGGLFAGITARYLARVARLLPSSDPTADETRAVCRHLVMRSAEAAWENSIRDRRGVLFGPDWSVSAAPVGRAARRQGERDLSVQLGGWMVTEAAAALFHADR